MAKLNVWVILVFSSLVLINALIWPPEPSCPERFLTILTRCNFTFSLREISFLDICLSSNFKCIGEAFRQVLNIDDANYNDTTLVEAIVDSGISKENVDNCVTKVGVKIKDEGINFLECQDNSIAALLICLCF